MDMNLNKRERQAMETQKKLLETSMELIISNGYHNVSISEICAKCNVAKGTFYTYFNSKRDIAVQILGDINYQMFKSMTWDDTMTAVEQFKEYTASYMRAVKNQGADFTKVFLSIMIQENFNYETVNANLHRDAVIRIINHGKESGEFKTTVPSETLQRYLQSYIFGVMMDWCCANGEYDIEEEGQKAIYTFLKILF